MKVVIVIPTFNRAAELKGLLLMLGNTKRPIDISVDIICVVDGSTDDTLPMLSQDFPDVHIVKGDGNWWYTKSMNEGFKFAMSKISPDLVLCLNDDIEIDENYLESILDAFEKSGGQCVMGSISVSVETPRLITFSGVKKEEKFPYRWKQYLDFMSPVNLEELNGIYESKELPGRGMLIPASALNATNLFDEGFPQYHSDFDFCLRAKMKGYDIKVSYDAVVYSHVDKTSDSTTFKKISISGFLKNLVNPYSRKHIWQNARYIWRHKPKPLFPFYYSKWFGLLIVNHIKVNVLD